MGETVCPVARLVADQGHPRRRRRQITLELRFPLRHELLELFGRTWSVDQPMTLAMNYWFVFCTYLYETTSVVFRIFPLAAVLACQTSAVHDMEAWKTVSVTTLGEPFRSASQLVGLRSADLCCICHSLDLCRIL